VTVHTDPSDLAWCPGCGNFGIREALKGALDELGIEPWQLVIVSGIGQAAKTPQYLNCNNLDGLHGRAVVTATGVKLANHKLRVIAEGGDGDMYAEGTNHLMHAMRRNIGITCLVHNNQVYGLTKGQFSPTSERGFPTVEKGDIPPRGVPFFHEPSFNPIAFAVAMEAGLVIRAFAGDIEPTKELIAQALQYPGFSLVDVLQPCVTFNKLNTFKWYKSRCYYLDDKYDPTDKAQAFAKSLEWGEHIPLGVIYRNNRPTLESQIPQLAASSLAASSLAASSLADVPLVERPVPSDQLKALIERFR
jgi:2-oxoglutarate ferredoxin oxidoreductase subunit beta